MARQEDYMAALSLCEALYRDVNAGNVTINSTTPWLNASGYETAAKLKTFINRFRDGCSDEYKNASENVDPGALCHTTTDL